MKNKTKIKKILDKYKDEAGSLTDCYIIGDMFFNDIAEDLDQLLQAERKSLLEDLLESFNGMLPEYFGEELEERIQAIKQLKDK